MQTGSITTFSGDDRPSALYNAAASCASSPIVTIGLVPCGRCGGNGVDRDGICTRCGGVGSLPR